VQFTLRIAFSKIMFVKKIKMKNYKLRPAESRFKVGVNIRKWRNMKEIKQKDLAVSLGLSEAAVSNIENDITNVTLTQLEDISTVLEVSMEQLLSDPQQQYLRKQESTPDPDPDNLQKQLIKAMIISLQKKDEQLQELMGLLISNFNGINSPVSYKRLSSNGAK